MILQFFRTGSVLLLAMTLPACGPQPRETIEAVDPEPEVINPDQADPVVARVNGTVIRRSDIQREFRAQQDEMGESADLTPVDFERIRTELVDQRLLAMEARARGLHQSEEARRRMAQAEERILSNVLVDEALGSAATDEAIRRIYDQQVRLIALGDEVRARHILVDTEEEADAAKALLDAGTDFATLAIRISLDPATRLEGGDLGYFSRGGIQEPYGSIAFNLAEGEVSAPFQTPFGWHIMKVEDRRRQPPPSFEALRPRIEEYYKFDQLVELVTALRDAGNVVLLDLPEPASDIDPDAAGESETEPAQSPEQ